MPPEVSVSGGHKVYAADYYFPEGFDLHTTRSIPIGNFAFSALASAQISGLPLFENQPKNGDPSQITKDKPPFGGRSCEICGMEFNEFLGGGSL